MESSIRLKSIQPLEMFKFCIKTETQIHTSGISMTDCKNLLALMTLWKLKKCSTKYKFCSFASNKSTLAQNISGTSPCKQKYSMHNLALLLNIYLRSPFLPPKNKSSSTTYPHFHRWRTPWITNTVVIYISSRKKALQLDVLFSQCLLSADFGLGVFLIYFI